MQKVLEKLNIKKIMEAVGHDDSEGIDEEETTPARNVV